jgi:hypothetical protein
VKPIASFKGLLEALIEGSRTIEVPLDTPSLRPFVPSCLISWLTIVQHFRRYGTASGR